MEILEKYFAGFTPEQETQFAALEDLYKDWNSKINVISRQDIDSLYEKHVLHSLSIAIVFDFSAGTDIIDIGTGGGFPGIPLAIYFPEVRFHLVDSIGKKLKVIEAVAEAIGLQNVTVEHTRAEDIRNRKFDFAVSRAVSSLKDLIRWSKPVLKPAVQKVLSADGIELYKPGLICLKGGDLKAEINESATKPKRIALEDLFEEEFFKEKYLLYV